MPPEHLSTADARIAVLNASLVVPPLRIPQGLALELLRALAHWELEAYWLTDVNLKIRALERALLDPQLAAFAPLRTALLSLPPAGVLALLERWARDSEELFPWPRPGHGGSATIRR